MHKKILLSYDSGCTFHNILPVLKNLYPDLNELTVVIFNVITQAQLQSSIRYNDKHLDELRNIERQYIEELLKDLDLYNIKYETLYTQGNPKKEILTEINKNNYDMVLMSTRKANNKIKNILGDVTHKVVKRSPIPVLIVK